MTAGATYTFGGKKFVSCNSKIDQSAINDELNKYRNELAQAQTDLADTKNAMVNARPVTQEVVKEVQVAGPRAVCTQNGRGNLSASFYIDGPFRIDIELST